MVVNRFEIARLKTIIAAADENAFVTISDISDTMGANVKLSKRRKKQDLPAEELPAEADAE